MRGARRPRGDRAVDPLELRLQRIDPRGALRSEGGRIAAEQPALDEEVDVARVVAPDRERDEVRLREARASSWGTVSQPAPWPGPPRLGRGRSGLRARAGPERPGDPSRRTHGPVRAVRVGNTGPAAARGERVDGGAGSPAAAPRSRRRGWSGRSGCWPARRWQGRARRGSTVRPLARRERVAEGDVGVRPPARPEEAAARATASRARGSAESIGAHGDMVPTVAAPATGESRSPRTGR